MADARKDKRTLLSLKIRYKSATLEDFIERYSSDISRGGVFIKAKKPLAVGTLLKFEFMLQDESTLLHGVGRVVWRREQADASHQNPAGMGIKFIKMDAGSRAVVEKIADDRARPGVFDQGKEGGDPLQPSDSEEPMGQDQTKVRHVSEFLASALQEGGAGEPARREAQAGAARARHQHDARSDASAYGAFAAQDGPTTEHGQSASEAQARGAMSAFGGPGGSSAARISSAAAPAFDEIDPEDDFLDDEATKVHEYPSESYRPEAVDTVIAKDASALLDAEKKPTPMVRADEPTDESLKGGVPDLFGTGDVDSFGPAPGEVIDADFFDSEHRQMGRPVPDTPGIPSEAYKLSRAAEPVWTTRPTPEQAARPVLIYLLIAVLVLAGGGVAAWQFGLLDDLVDSLALGSSEITEPSSAAVPLAAVKATEPDEPDEADADATPIDEGSEGQASASPEQDQVDDAAAAAEPEATAAAPAEDVAPGVVKFEITTLPVGAFITVNGKRKGRTPIVVEQEVGTKLTVYSKVRGYLGQRRQILVAANQESLTLQLVPLPYVVQLETDPPGAMASAVGGGVVVTPGEMRFKSMPRSRRIVFSMNGYETSTKFVKRASFTEETRRMFTTVNVTLQEEGAASSTEEAAAPPSEQDTEPTPEPIEATPEPAAAPAPSEVNAEATPPAEPEPVEEAAPSETAPVDAP
ncbi:MAG: TIGR02266 family protein [Deltaproteobacteria bacterium]|nr:TIGR02266 family protein [Deltaproteobacteria bacterium]NNK05863.1 TIGR02266 family protein [Myxococcales bacterium]NNK41597.1 TIGR02266 family protein [Myxococcales bacterium]